MTTQAKTAEIIVPITLSLDECSTIEEALSRYVNICIDKGWEQDERNAFDLMQKVIRSMDRRARGA